MMLTRAERRGDRYVVRGRKWFITGAEGAAHFILLARTSRRPAPRPHRHAVPLGPARLAHPAPHPDHGPGGAWRALRARVRRPRGPGRERAHGRGPGHEGDPDPPRHRAADPLHALARHGAPGARDRPALYPRAAGLRPAPGRQGERAGPARRGRDGDRDRPPAHHARGLRLEQGGQARARGLDGQDPGRRRAAPGGRHGDPAPGCQGLRQGHAARVDVPLRPPGAPGRRCLGGASHGRGARAPATQRPGLLPHGAEHERSATRSPAGSRPRPGRSGRARAPGAAGRRRDPGELGARPRLPRAAASTAGTSSFCAPTQPRASR